MLAISDVVWLALIGIPTILVTAWMRHVDRRDEAAIRHRERIEDYARQDAVARRVAEVADTAKVSADATATTLAAIADTGDKVHVLVNNNLTVTLSDALAADERSLALMLELIDVKRSSGVEPTPVILAAVEAARVRIEERKAELAVRAKAQGVVDAT